MPWNRSLLYNYQNTSIPSLDKHLKEKKNYSIFRSYTLFMIASLFLKIYSPSFFFLPFSEHNCKDFRCNLKEFCINSELVCDGISHCEDGSDESTSTLCASEYMTMFFLFVVSFSSNFFIAFRVRKKYFLSSSFGVHVMNHIKYEFLHQ